MDFNTTTYLAGLTIGILVSLDAIIVGLFGMFLGFTVDGIIIFFGGGIKRRMGKKVWNLGFIPMGSSVAIRGLGREPDQAPSPEDFDQHPLGKRIALLLIDKVFLGTILVVLLSQIPTIGGRSGLEMVFDQFAYIFSMSPDAAKPAIPADHLAFIMALIAFWLLFSALLPVGNNKTQILLGSLIPLKPNNLTRIISYAGILLGMVVFAYFLYCLILYININYEGQVLTTWISAVLGTYTVYVFWAIVFTLTGKPVGKKTTSQENAPS